MKNFLVGLVVGVCVAYWYFASDELIGAVEDFWNRASAPPSMARRHP